MASHRGRLLGVVLLAVVAAGACRSIRWSGHHKHDEFEPKAAHSGLAPDYSQERGELDVHEATAPVRARKPMPALPPPPSDSAVLFYSDLGPDEIDIKGYPAQQWANYRLFKARCSQCHAAARAINAPAASRLWWWFYIRNMRNRSKSHGAVVIAPDEAKRIAEFLEYDGQRRKVADSAEFDRLTQELERRFDEVVERRMESLQKSSPRVRGE